MAQSEEYGSILRSDDSEIALDISSEEDDFSSDESGEVNVCFLFWCSGPPRQFWGPPNQNTPPPHENSIL